jgi:hypothetical protein
MNAGKERLGKIGDGFLAEPPPDERGNRLVIDVGSRDRDLARHPELARPAEER